MRESQRSSQGGGVGPRAHRWSFCASCPAPLPARRSGHGTWRTNALSPAFQLMSRSRGSIWATVRWKICRMRSSAARFARGAALPGDPRAIYRGGIFRQAVLIKLLTAHMPKVYGENQHVRIQQARHLTLDEFDEKMRCSAKKRPGPPTKLVG